MTARIYTGADARALREAAPPGRWHLDGDVRDANDQRVALVATGHPMSSGTFDLLVATPDLAASVEHHEQRAERAEAERDAIDADREALWQGVWAHVEGGVGLDTPRDRAEVIARVAAVVAERDALRAAVREYLAAKAERDDARKTSRELTFECSERSTAARMALDEARLRLREAAEELAALVPAEAPDAR